MHLVRFKEKHADRFFIAADEIELHTIAASVAAERLAEGFWYDTDNGDPQRSFFKTPVQQLSDAERVQWYLDRIRNPSLRAVNCNREHYLKRLYLWMRSRESYQYEEMRIEHISVLDAESLEETPI